MQTNEQPSNNFAGLEATIGNWLLINDPGLIKVTTGCVLANRLNADPVWLFIVTASGGTKTELLRGLNGLDDIYPISDLTAQTFLSGEKNNKTASLLHRLPPRVTITMKDFTTVLTMHRDKQHAILSQLREIYDGQFRKEFGTGETKEWEGKLGFIAGVTSVIDQHYSVYQALGERFIQYRPSQPDPIKVSLKAIGNSGNEAQMREEIKTAFTEYIASVDIPTERIEIPDYITNRLVHLAAFCVRARSSVIRDTYSTREIELIPEAELPTRLAKQFSTLLCGLSLISGGFTEADYQLIYKIGMDTVPRKRRMVLDLLIASETPLETAKIASDANYPKNTVRRTLEELHGLRLITRDSSGMNMSDLWSLHDSTRQLLAKAQSDQANPLGLVNQVFFDGGGIPEMSILPAEDAPMI